MDSAPDSAYTLLQTLDAKEFCKRSTCVHYALLYTQAQVKNYIDESDDFLIQGFIPFMVGDSKEGFWFPLTADVIGGWVMSIIGIFSVCLYSP